MVFFLNLTHFTHYSVLEVIKVTFIKYIVRSFLIVVKGWHLYARVVLDIEGVLAVVDHRLVRHLFVNLNWVGHSRVVGSSVGLGGSLVCYLQVVFELDHLGLLLLAFVDLHALELGQESLQV